MFRVSLSAENQWGGILLFNSLTFLVFFCVVFSLYQLIESWSWRKRLLLISSYLFYAAWSPPFVLLLAFSTGVDWGLGLLLSKQEHHGRRRALLLLSLVSNLGLLGYFKYGGFLLETVKVVLQKAGIHYEPVSLSIILPVGISFYTFQSLSYTIDVYRRRLPPCHSLSDFALYVSFFPQLVAGPIVRASDFLPQLIVPRRGSSEQIGWGLVLMVLGVFQKVVLADSILAPVADTVFGAPLKFQGIDAVAGVLSFSCQIFYDFAGYSLCAIGCALCFGFVLPDNFKYPYSAISFSDFWRRWHISLSTWLRDYLYVPLGGNQKGLHRTYLNLMLTMLIGGLWHGASWMFVLWGGLHGLFLVVERRYQLSGSGWILRSPFLSALLVFLLVSLIWIPFRAHNGHDAISMLVGTLLWRHESTLPFYQLAMASMVCVLTFLTQYQWRNTFFEERFRHLSGGVKTLALAGMLICLFLSSGGDERAFIYFQF